MKIKFIHRMTLSLYLQEQGHKVLFTAPHKKKPGFIVWAFQDTQALNADMSIYLSGDIYE